ncbi:MAG TPA: PVC-type heme-binding CxxCH protein [Pirellulaceae bacterium]|jgi:putative membrane-bound dehydrogenase-like protein|nr:PVC-type heme-binding CxxCH protein [Pirellulaceae bacterium]
MIRTRPVVKFLFVALAALAATNALHAAEKKKVLFFAGPPSHGYGSHEHYAGCMLLAKSLQEAMPDYEVDVIRSKWPEKGWLDDADVLVMYSDGGGGHPVNPHLKEVDEQANRGMGVVCIHYAVEVPKGESGQALLDWIGGYFETDWSVNPHWVADFKAMPDHPITRGVKPFQADDEWYYHMRFREGMADVTPILTAIPPESTLSRPDGPHSGNPHVRAKKGQPQHVAWAAERPDGGRGFGFTGGHWHWNWGNPDFRKTVLNAIVWCAKDEVPKNGVDAGKVNLDRLLENQDEPKPENLNTEEIKKKYDVSGGMAPANASGGTSSGGNSGSGAKPLFKSEVVTAATKDRGVAVDVNIKGKKELYLVVNDGGDGFGCDWAAWVEPKLVGPKGEKKLTDLKWKFAATDFGQVRVDANANGGSISIDGKQPAFGIGTHANSLIAYDLPEGYERFVAKAAVDDGGVKQGCGTTVQFLVFDSRPAATVIQPSAQAGGREPELALEGLDVAEDLVCQLFSHEPMIHSPSNIDVDHLGRIWLCEIVNYRPFANKDIIPKDTPGDRILVLEDTDADGKSDKSTVFYQGKDIDSPHGICYLGDQVIVSVGDKVLVFFDDNGDLKADRQEVMFSGISGAQHDHGIHAFVFGPDGKLYFNFGNAGKQIRDRDGKPIVDLAGNEINDSRRPYQEGMIFRCDLDGSNVETLAWNFRNNWEVCIDSFGALWQSDNDDDGNRGVRINYVMEFGNFGYKDEFTGAGWQSPRTNLEQEIPLRHWHLNDPGVVPNLLQTGGGSPTGITIYEGELLPPVYQGEIIHCDAGPSIVRAYPVEPEGAGYTAEMLPMLSGTRDKWFRPSDVSVAPDGSILVADWYDAGVGGHRFVDAERGRVFRLTVPGQEKYAMPKLDFTAPEGAVAALFNPNSAAHALAFMALMKMGEKAQPALQKAFTESDDPRTRARAMFALGKLRPGTDLAYKTIETALQDDNVNVRIAALRLARQVYRPVLDEKGVDRTKNSAALASFVATAANDADPALRREAAIALRTLGSYASPDLWAALAQQYDGEDRWYLEALGIGAAGRWDEFLGAYLNSAGADLREKRVRDIVWRSRASSTPTLLTGAILDPATPEEELPRLIRSLDFQSGPIVQPALLALSFAPIADPKRAAFVHQEALSRLSSDAIGNRRGELLASLSTLDVDPSYVSLVKRFGLVELYPRLLEAAIAAPESQTAAEAMQALLDGNQEQALIAKLKELDAPQAAALVRSLGVAQSPKSLEILIPIVLDKERDLEVRRQAVRAAATTKQGAQRLLDHAEKGRIDAELKVAAGASLYASTDSGIRDAATKYFPLPQPVAGEKIPPVADLIKRNGNAGSGQKVYLAEKSQCAKCHVIGDQGKEVGPNLSEIGSKLSPQALYESILYPSAGISHNYETWTYVLSDGSVVTGIPVSDTATEVVVKTSEGVSKTIAKTEVEESKKSEVSLMPADLHAQMKIAELVDLVEYLKAQKAKQ